MTKLLSKFFKFGLSDLFVLLALGSLVFLQFDYFADDPGVGWHLKTGELIFQRGVVPKVDPFLYSAEPRAWVADQWLSDLVFFLVYDKAGWPALYSMLCAVFLLTFCGVVFKTSLTTSGSAIAASFASFIALKLACIHFILRPVIFSFLIFAAVSAIAWRLAVKLRSVDPNEIAGQKPKISSYLAIPFIFLIWANLHPSFVLGLLLLGCLLCGLAYDFLFVLRQRGRIKFLIPLALALLFSLAATLINPYGYSLHHQILELGSSEYFMKLHDEWLPLNMQSAVGRMVQFVALLLILAIALRSAFKCSWGFVELFCVGIFLHLALESVRFLPYFAILVAPLLSQATVKLAKSELFLRFEKLNLLRRLVVWLEQRERGTLYGQHLLMIIIAILLYTLSGATPLLQISKSYGPRLESYPYAALDQLKNKIDQKKAVVVAFPNWGGFITWYGAPNIQAVIDDRNNLIGESGYKRFYSELRIGGDFKSLLRDLKASHLLLPSSSSLAIHLKELKVLTLVYQDQTATLFELANS